MATFLDVGLFGYFSVIFPLLLVFLIVFAVLSKTEFFGKNKGVYSLIAFALAMMMLFTPGVIKVINVMAPWFVFLFMFSILFMVVLMVMGVKSDAIVDYMSGRWDVAHWFMLVIAIIVGIGALASVYGGAFLPYTDSDAGDGAVDTDVSVDSLETGQSTSTGDFNANVARVIFHPKVLGLIFLLLIASFTIRMMAHSTS